MTHDEALLRKASFEQLLRKNERRAEEETDKDLVRRSISIPSSVDVRVELLVEKYNSNYKRVYMTLTEFGYYKMLEDYADLIGNIKSMRREIITTPNKNIRHMIARGKTKVDYLFDAEENSIVIATPIHIEIRNYARFLNVVASSLIRFLWYKSLSSLEAKDGFDEFEKGEFDSQISVFENHLNNSCEAIGAILIGLRGMSKNEE